MEKNLTLHLFLALAALLLPWPAAGQSPGSDPSPAVQRPPLVIGNCTACADVRNGVPEQAAAAFSADLKRVYCYTDFTSVSEKTVTYHNWYLRDKLKARIKLTLQPPRWSTYSSLPVHDSEKGPWRVEVTDEEGNLLKALYFSVID
ncbi:MAG: DUF2914 domain-containing protein [Desulfobacterales bacterium]